MSTGERSKKIMALFDEIYELSADLREARLNDIGAQDPSMKEELLQLLRNMEAANERSFLASTQPLSEQAPTIDRQIGPFKIEQVLASGGMGKVYKARHVHLDRLIALKVPHLLHPNREHLFERLQREGKALAQLDHPNIVKVYDAGVTEDDVPFVAMAFLDGKNLSQAFPGHKAPEEVVVKWGIQLAEALDYLHQHKIYHRDIKTANIILDKAGNAVLADFGIAYVEDMTRMTAANLPGTLAYMCPEQMKGRPIDGRCDLYSLGIVLFELLAGERPDDKSLRYYRPELSDKLIRVVDKCLEHNPAHRFQTGADLARAPSFNQKTVEPREKKKTRLWAAIASILVILAVGSYSLLGPTSNSTPPPPPSLIESIVGSGDVMSILEQRLIRHAREGSLTYGRSADLFFNPDDCHIIVYQNALDVPTAVLAPGSPRKDILSDTIVDDLDSYLENKSTIWVLITE